MNKTLKILCALLLCACLVFSLGAAALADVGDELRAPKKIISVVYDDSTSMQGKRWVNASYAMQALTALLNTGDELYITYMSRPDKSVKQDLDDIQRTVSGIRNWDTANNTPAESMDTAFQQLKSVKETDESSQFWLIVMTDGEFQDLDEPLQDKLEGFRGAAMSNGSALNVAYMGMGSGAERVKEDTGAGLYSFQADDDAGITSDMEEVAKLVSGRLTADDVTLLDEYTVEFTSPLPLFSISVLSQNSSAEVTEARTAEQALSIRRSVALDAFEPFYTVSDTLYGNAAVIAMEDGSGAGKIIPAARYTITFSEPVSLSDLTIQYEPAIALKAILREDGNAVQDPDALKFGQTIDIELVAVVPGTDDVIPDSDLPRGIDWSLEFSADGLVTASAQDRVLRDVSLHEGECSVRGTMTIPGYTPLVREIRFEITVPWEYIGLEVQQPDPLTYYRRSVNRGSVEGEEVRFLLTLNGEPMTKEEIDALGVRLDIDDVSVAPWQPDPNATGFSDRALQRIYRLGKLPVDCTLRENDDGSFSLTPRSSALFAALLAPGDYSVQVSVRQNSSAVAVGAFSLEPLPGDVLNLLWLLIAAYLLINLICILLFRRKFTGQQIFYEVFELVGSEGLELRNMAEPVRSLNILRGWPLKHLIWPLGICWSPCRYRVHNLVLQAEAGGAVLVTGASIAKTVYAYASSNLDPESDLDRIMNIMRPTRPEGEDAGGRELLPDEPLYPGDCIYFLDSAGSNKVWRLRME